jgi:hypothetical protein
MKYFYFFSFLILLFSSCRKEEFIKTTLFIEEFNDNSKGWFSSPDTNILYSSNECIKIEDSQLKMHFERGLGIPNCGGGWLAIILNDSSLNRVEYFGSIGIKIVLSEGFFQELGFIDSVIGNTTYGHQLQTSSFNMEFGKHKLDFPLSVLVDSIDLDINQFNGKEFVLLSNSDWTKNKIYIDGNVIDYSGNIHWYQAQGNTYDFKIRFELGYGQELMPHTLDLFIESVEIFTWEGEFCINNI